MLPPKSFSQSFNNLNPDMAGFSRPDELSRIPIKSTLFDDLAKTAQEAAAAFPGEDELGKLMVLPLPGWGAPLFATDAVMQQLTQGAALKEVLADHHFQKVRDQVVNTEFSQAESEAKAGGKTFDPNAPDVQQKVQKAVDGLTQQAMYELMTPDPSRKPEDALMQSDPEKINDEIEQIIRETTDAYALQSSSKGALALPNAPINIMQTVGDDESGDPSKIQKIIIGQVAVQLIGLPESHNFKVEYPATFTAEMSAQGTMDLAIGNIIFKNDPDAAEAFAALRHRQRFPHQQTDYVMYRNEAMASDVILKGDADTYAADALKLAMQKADELGDNIAALSLKDIAALAEDIADKAVPDGTTLNKIEDAFKPAADYYQSYIAKKTSDNETQAREKIAQMVLETKMTSTDPDIRAVADNFMTPPETKRFMEANAATIVGDEITPAKPAAAKPAAAAPARP